MKIAIAYIWVERPSSRIALPDDWMNRLKKFVDSFTESEGINSADLFICSSGSPLSEKSLQILENIKYSSIEYYGSGWDIGAYQHMARYLISYDFTIFLNSNISFNTINWYKNFTEAFKKYGYGVYGASSSFEVSPHIRTSCIATPAKLLLDYPLAVKTRYEGCIFEHSPKNFSIWAKGQGYKVAIVTPTIVLDLQESRSYPNVFRRGDQSECFISDRHTQIYSLSNKVNKKRLEELADGVIRNDFRYLSKFRNNLTKAINLYYVFKNIIQRYFDIK